MDHYCEAAQKTTIGSAQWSGVRSHAEERVRLKQWRKPRDIMVTPADILCGRDKSSYHHAGNRRFRKFVESSARAYRRANQEDKAHLIFTAVRSVRANGGRFLKKQCDNSKHGSGGQQWVELTTEQINKKVGRAIRDAATFQEMGKAKRRKIKRIVRGGNHCDNNQAKSSLLVKEVGANSHCNPAVSVQDLVSKYVRLTAHLQNKRDEECQHHHQSDNDDTAPGKLVDSGDFSDNKQSLLKWALSDMVASSSSTKRQLRASRAVLGVSGTNCKLIARNSHPPHQGGNNEYLQLYEASYPPSQNHGGGRDATSEAHSSCLCDDLFHEKTSNLRPTMTPVDPLPINFEESVVPFSVPDESPLRLDGDPSGGRGEEDPEALQLLLPKTGISTDDDVYSPGDEQQQENDEFSSWIDKVLGPTAASPNIEDPFNLVLKDNSRNK